jgi:lauroyl/myristoyl acyltransferase
MTRLYQKRAAWPNESRDQPAGLETGSAGNMTYLLASLSLIAMRAVPSPQRVRWINTASPFMARLLYAANVHSVRTIRQNLRRLFGSDRPPQMIERDIHQLLSISVWNSLIIYSLPVLAPQQIAELAPIEELAHLEDSITGDRPVLIWGYHFGVQPLIVAAVLSARGYPIHAVTHVREIPSAASSARRSYLYRLQAIGDLLSVIDPQEGVQRKTLDVLTAKECLYVTPDYMIAVDEAHPCPPFTVPVEFLGQTAFLQTGGLRLAKRLGARVITVLSQADKDWRRLRVEPLELPTTGLTPDDLQRDLQVGMQRLEVQVRRLPYLWLDLKRDDLAERLKPVPAKKAPQDR